MKEFDQIRSFYMELSDVHKCDMTEAIADDIMFFDEEFQSEIIYFLCEVVPDLGIRIKEINGFTL